MMLEHSYRTDQIAIKTLQKIKKNFETDTFVTQRVECTGFPGRNLGSDSEITRDRRKPLKTGCHISESFNDYNNIQFQPFANDEWGRFSSFEKKRRVFCFSQNPYVNPRASKNLKPFLSIYVQTITNKHKWESMRDSLSTKLHNSGILNKD